MFLHKLLFIALLLVYGFGEAATLQWDANTDEVSGYKIYYGPQSRNYTDSVDVGNVTSWGPLELLLGDGPTYITATAYLIDGTEILESEYSSEEVVWVAFPPSPATGVYATFFLIPSTLINKTNWSILYFDSEEVTGEDGAVINAIDGDSLTFWHTEWYYVEPPCPHEIQIDLGQIYTIGGLKYLPRQDGGINGTIRDFEFYVSNDGVIWELKATGTFESNVTEKDIFFPMVSARFVRFRAISEIASNPWTSIAEFDLFGF